MKQHPVLLRQISKESVFRHNGTQKLEVLSEFVNLLYKKLKISGNDHFPKKHSKANLFSCGNKSLTASSTEQWSTGIKILHYRFSVTLSYTFLKADQNLPLTETGETHSYYALRRIKQIFITALFIAHARKPFLCYKIPPSTPNSYFKVG